VGYNFKLTNIPFQGSEKYFCIMCSAVGIQELKKILDERPEAQTNNSRSQKRVSVTNSGTLRIAAIRPFSRSVKPKETKHPSQSGNRI
jgi:hypothetical protein